MKITPVFLMAITLVGCGTTQVSPALSGKPGVVTAIGADGYPVVKSITITRALTAPPERAATCVAKSVDKPESAPIISTDVQVSGLAAFRNDMEGFTRTFRYTLARSNEGVYVFDRLRYTGQGTVGIEVMASKYWSPENVYAELQSITDRVDRCLRSS